MTCKDAAFDRSEASESASGIQILLWWRSAGPAEDTDDRARLIVHAYLATEYRRIAAEAFLPELVRQHDDTVAARHTFVRTERAAECERMAEAEHRGVATPAPTFSG
jgi:hypothetical protein